MMSEPTNGSTLKNPKATETISRLQRGILRLALSYHGQNPQLDAHLHELGMLVRNGTKDARLQRLIDEIVDIIVAQDITQNSSQKGGRTLCALLERIDAKFPQSSALQAIIARLELPLDKQNFDLALDEAAETIADLKRGAPVTDDGVDRALTRLLDNIEFPAAATHDINALKARLHDCKGEIELIRSLDDAAAIISRQACAWRRYASHRGRA